MAQSLQTLRNSSIKRAHPLGRNLGIDRDGYLVGAPDMRGVIVDYTSASTATSVLPYGTHVFTLTTLSTQTFALDAPVVGVDVLILARDQAGANPSSQCTIIRGSSNFSIISTDGGTSATRVFLSSAAFVHLRGITSDVYAVISRTESSNSLQTSAGST